jgi:hypothetical protein
MAPIYRRHSRAKPNEKLPRRISYLLLPIDSLPRSRLHVNGLKPHYVADIHMMQQVLAR